jgi:hypothetical protein
MTKRFWRELNILPGPGRKPEVCGHPFVASSVQERHYSESSLHL